MREQSRDAPLTNSLSERAVTAGQWRVGSMLLQGVLQFGVGVLLARLVPPGDFGVVALAVVVVGFATMLADLGLGPAIVQRRQLTDSHLRVAFTASMLVGLGMAAALMLLSPWIGALARDHTLPAVLRVQGLLFIVTGSGTVARALLQRNLDFRRLFVIEVASYTGGYALVAVGGALAGWGVWSLVLGSLVQGLLSSVLSLLAVRPPVRPLLSRAELRQLLGFGLGVSVNGVVSYVARSGDNFLVGQLLGVTALGLYSRAFNLMMLPLTYICSALPNVLLPAFAEIQGDRRRVGRGFLVSLQLTAMTTAPIMAGMIVSAPHMIRGLYGERWAGAVLPLQILCLVGLPRAVHSLAGPVNRACGRVYTELWLQIGFATAVLAGAVVGATRGITGVALLVSLAIALMYAAMARLVLTITAVTWRAFAMAQVPGLFLGLVTAAVTIPLRLALEYTGAPHLVTFVALLLGSAGSVPLGILLLPVPMRPMELFAHLHAPLRRLPAPLRIGLTHLLRTPA